MKESINIKKILLISASIVMVILVSLYVQGAMAGPGFGDMEDMIAVSSDETVYMVQEKGKELWIYGIREDTLVYACQITDSGSDSGNSMIALTCREDILYGLVEQCSRITGQPYQWQIVRIDRKNRITEIAAVLNQNMLSEAYDLYVNQDQLYVAGLSKDRSQAMVYQVGGKEPEVSAKVSIAFGQGNLYLLLDNGSIDICTPKNRLSLLEVRDKTGFFLHSPQAVWYYNPQMDQITRLTVSMDMSQDILPDWKLRAAAMTEDYRLYSLAEKEGKSTSLVSHYRGQWKEIKSLSLSPQILADFANPYALKTVFTVLAASGLAGLIWWAYGRNGRISFKLSALCLMVSLILAVGWYCFLKASQAYIGIQLPLIRMSIAIFAIMIFTFYLQVDYITRPLRSLPRFMDKLASGNYKVEKKFLSNDEVGYAWAALNRMAAELESKRYKNRELLKSYYRFVPRDMHTLFDKKGITDLKAGDMKEMHGLIGLIAVQNRYEIRKLATDGEYAAIIKECFRLADDACSQYGGIIADNDFNLSGIHILFREDADVAAFGRDLTGRCRSRNQGAAHPLKLLLMVHKTSYLYGLGGTAERAFPCFISSEAEILLDYVHHLKETGVDLAVTEEVYKEMEASVDGRYLGFLPSRDSSFTCKLYEVLDACPDIQKTLKKQTNEKLQKGIQLFYKNDFYLARNLFSAVLKENTEDGIARWYLFASEYYFDLGKAQDVDYSLLHDIRQKDRTGGAHESSI